jgi:Predicted membrane protein (DUF2079)
MNFTRRFVQIGQGAAWLASFVALACGLTWPLALHLPTHLLGDPTGDTGVYVWNLWIFRHELLRHGHLPFSTDHVFSYTGGADFALHNYTPVAGLLGTPLISLIGVVATFNVVMIALIAFTGVSAFALARQVGLGRIASWTVGALFIASPVLTARQTAHFSLVIAAPLPLFLWALLRTLKSLRTRDAVIVGIVCATASYADAYYGVYCALMGVFVVVWRFTRFERNAAVSDSATPVRVVDTAILLVGLAIAWRVLSGTTSVSIGAIRIRLETLYTPMLMLAVLVSARGWLHWRPVVHLQDPDGHVPVLVRRGIVAITVCLALLSPVLLGIALRFFGDRLPHTETYWRSSPRGVDMLAYFVPNPNHAWFGDVTGRWLLPDKPDAFPEFVGSFSIVAFGLIAVAAARRVLPAVWIAFTALFVSLSLGPFVYVAGVNTYIPAPWALLRYMPVIGMARSPSRFAVVAILGMCLLFGFAVEEAFRVRTRTPSRRRLVTGAVAAALMIELMAVPRTLYSAAVPDVYRLITTTSDETGRLLELPTGIRDGTSSLGDFNASTQYFQTSHRRRLIGGYLSRVSRWRRTEDMRAPILRALFTLSEGRDISDEWKQEALRSRDAFLARSCVRFVIINRLRATESLRSFAVDTLNLTSVHQDQRYELFIPTNPPACTLPASGEPRPLVRDVGLRE